MFPFHSSIPDFPFLPTGINCDVQFFTSSNDASGTFTQRWTKPRGCSMAYMVVVGGGGGGGGGHSAASTNARGGGGGGASGSMCKALFPIIFLPDSLAIRVGKGGPGGTATNDGTNGAVTTITTDDNSTTVPNLIIQTAGGTLGAKGTGATGGAGGGTSAAQPPGPSTLFGLFLSTQNIAGSNGGAQTGAIGAALTSQWTTIGLTPGAGGAGVNGVNTGFAGGSISIAGTALRFTDGSVEPSAILAGGAAGSAAAAGNGLNGFQLTKPFFGLGGSGGGSSDGSTGGNGGNGAIGCGGGGGGGGVTGGTGGNGGGGFVLIVSW